MYKCITNISELQAYLESASIAAFDFETAPDEKYRDEEKAALDPHKSHIVGISFSKAEGESIYLPIAHKIGKNAEELTEIWQWLADSFSQIPTL